MSTATTPQPEISPTEKQWLTQLAGASSGPAKSTASLDKSTEKISENIEMIRANMSFTVELAKQPGMLNALKYAMSKKTMKSLTGTGNAMKEIDTVHESGKLKSISAKDMKRAMEAMELIETESAKARETLLAERLEESEGLGAKREKIEEFLALKKKAKAENTPAPEMPSDFTEDDLTKYSELVDGVDLDVANEIWTPLVRQGAMPENLVPDRYSDVMRTFKGASDAYTEHLEEYTKGLEDNHELLRRLGVANDVVDKCAKLTNGIAQLIPGAPAGVLETVKQSTELFTIVADGSFKTAEIIIKNEGLQSVFENGANVVADVCGKLIGDPMIGAIVQSGIKASIGGGRIIQALVDKDPQAGIKAFGMVLEQSFSVVASSTGDKEWKSIGAMANKLCVSSASGAKLIKVVKGGGTPEEIKAALGDFLKDSADTLNAALKPAIEQATENDKETDAIMDFTTEAVKDLITVGTAKDKIAALTTAVSNIAGRACETFIEPAKLGKSVGDLVKTSITTSSAAAKAIQEKNLGKLADALLDGAAKALSSAADLTDDPEVKKALKAASSSVVLTAQARKVAEAVISGRTSDIDTATSEFFNSLAEKVSALLPKAEEEDEDEESGDDDEDTEGDDEQEADDEDKGEADESGEEAKQLDDKTVASLQASINKGRAIFKNPKSTPKEKEEAMKIVMAASKELVDQETMASELANAGSEFADKLEKSFGDPEDPDYEGEDIRTVQQMILQIQKDRKIFELVEKLSSLPLQVAAHFFPPMGAALDFKKFTFEVMKAVAHTRALIQWMNNAGDAKSAVSVQVHAMLSRVHCEKRQVLEHNCRAAIALTAAIGQVVTTVGAHAAPVGVAMTAASRVAETGLEIAKQVVDEAEMAKAWSEFQKAMRNPQDRKVARNAIEINPTLAKYAIAWGALKGGDPIAKNAMKKCGLTDAVLARPSTNVREVQDYLQNLFVEDIVVLKAVPIKKGWYPSPQPALTLRSWTAFYAAAVSKAKLKPGTGGSVAQAMTTLELRMSNVKSANEELKLATELFEHAKAQAKKDEANKLKSGGEVAPSELGNAPEPPAVTKAKLRKEKAVASVTAKRKSLRGALETVKAAAGKFAPLNVSDEPHAEMREYLDALMAQAELKLREMKGETVALVLDEAA